MSIHLILTLVTLLVVVIMFLSGKFNFGWIGMFCATFLCATGVLSFKDAYANFASTNVVMVGAMFILAGALGKTTLVDHVRNWIMSKGTSGRSIVFLYLLGSILLTQLVSPLGVIAMLLPLTAALDENSPVQPSQLLYPGAVCSHTSQAMLPVGAGLTYFVTANALMEANGAEQRFTMFDKSAVVFVPALVAFLYMAFIGWKHFPVIKIDAAKIDESRAGKAKKIDPKTEKVIYIVFILTMIAICFNSYLPFPMYIIPIIADLILGALGCINMKEAKQYVNFETILMLAGLLCLATAMQQTGAADLVAEFIVKALGGNPSPLAIMVAFYVVGATMTQIMSNTATYNVLIPLAIITCVSRGVDPRGVVLAISCGTTGAMLTPMSSPSIAIAFGAGGYKIKDVFLACLPLWFLYGITVIIMANLRFPMV